MGAPFGSDKLICHKENFPKEVRLEVSQAVSSKYRKQTKTKQMHIELHIHINKNFQNKIEVIHLATKITCYLHTWERRNGEGTVKT